MNHFPTKVRSATTYCTTDALTAGVCTGTNQPDHGLTTSDVAHAVWKPLRQSKSGRYTFDAVRNNTQVVDKIPIEDADGYAHHYNLQV